MGKGSLARFLLCLVLLMAMLDLFVSLQPSKGPCICTYIYIYKHIHMLGACMYKHVNGPIRYKGLRATKLPSILSSECFQ